MNAAGAAQRRQHIELVPGSQCQWGRREWGVPAGAMGCLPLGAEGLSLPSLFLSSPLGLAPSSAES